MSRSATLQMRPAHWFSTDWQVVAEGRLAGVIAVRRGGEGTLRLGGHAYQLRRSQTAEWELVNGEDGAVVAWTATTRPMDGSAGYGLQVAGEGYTLSKDGGLSGGVVVARHGIPVGRVQRRGIFQQGVRAYFASELPLCVQVFIVWLSLSLWRNEDALVAATTVVLMGN